MEILKSNPGWKQEHKQNGDFLSNVLDRVFAISKRDKSFSMKSQHETLDLELTKFKEKNKKQEKLLAQAATMTKDTDRRLKDINEQNFSMKTKLLELLGNE